MRTNSFLTLFLLVCLFAPGLALGQDTTNPDDEVENARGAFIKSREPKVPTAGNQGALGASGDIPSHKFKEKNSPRDRKKLKPSPKPDVKPPIDTNAGKPPLKVKFTPANMGLGYSLFQRGTDGKPVRVDPANEFRTGDELRIWLEPGAAGYLYIFNTTNDGAATLLYPSTRLNQGNNKIKAHIPFELPSAKESKPEDRWFIFDGSTGVEQIYIVLSKQPLESLPVNKKDLASFCAKNQNATSKCPLPDETWSGIKALDLKEQVFVAKSAAEIGQKQSKAEQPTTSRGFGLAPKAPAPTVVFMNVSEDRNLLFAKLELKHN